MIGFGYNFSIPPFSIALILIDAAIELILKRNFIKQLAIATSLNINKTEHKIYLTQKLFKPEYKEVFKYKARNTIIPKVFLTISERHWLQTEIARYL